MAQVIHQPASRQTSRLFRTWLQDKFFEAGFFIQKHAGKVLFVGILALVASCAALKSAAIETRIDQLWVEEDGRLEKELNYMKSTLGEGIGNTNQLLIQTPKDANANILHADALLYHLEVMQAASEITVDLFEVTWRLKDVCLTPSIPSFEEAHIEKIFDHLFPCAIVSPLDCFWEGSKILGPEYPVTVPGFSLNVKWTNLNPQSMVSALKDMQKYSSPTFPFASFQEIMKRAGITSAYQEKPCLNPNDTECPSTAPNKGRSAPDVGAELTGGCYGFATKYMHWPEDLIVGGAKKNRTGHIVKAHAIQSVIQMMGEQEMFDFWAKDYKVHNIDWSLEKAKLVLEAWQRRFSQEISKLVGINRRSEEDVLPNSKHYSISLFTSTLLDDIMENFSLVNHAKIAIGLIVISLYVVIMCSNRRDPLSSQGFVGMAGVALVALSIVSALGLCALLRLPLNAATTHVTPFFALGYGVYLLFLLVNTYTTNKSSDKYYDDATGEALQQIGPIILLVSTCGILGFLSSAIIPIPALRAFVLQFAIILAVITASLLLLFPAVVSLDLRRRRSLRMDFFCCFKVEDSDELRCRNRVSNSSRHPLSSASLPNHRVKLNNEQQVPAGKSVYADNLCMNNSLNRKSFPQSARPPMDDETEETDTEEQVGQGMERQSLHRITSPPECQLALKYLSRRVHGKMLQKKPVKVVVMLLFAILFAVCLSGISKVKDGLELTDIVPRGTVEHKFLDVQRKYFSFYHMSAVTEGNFEYPTNQKLLYEYHHSFTRIAKIIKNDDGGLPDFWLSTFRDWLANLQAAYERDAAAGLISQEGWLRNASDEGVLAFKLLVQTGRNDYPIDKSLVNKVKLVDASGIINPKAFYTYLTAWVSNDALAYYASQANFRPEPREWIHVPTDFELKIPKSQPLIYTQLPFYLNRMRSTEEITATIIEIRSICQKYEERGLPNFPHGIPFTFWEQYVRLPLYLVSAGIVVTALVFLVICLALFSAWAASLIVVLEVAIVAQLYGLMGIFEIPLSALPSVILIISVGIGTIFFLPLTVCFLSVLGKRNHRMLLSLEQMMPPTVHGIVSTMLGVSMLAFSEFDFIVKCFFCVLCGFMIFGSLYGLLLLPILLSMIGPPPEITPSDRRDRISAPAATPDIRRKIRKIKALPSHYFSKREFPRVQSDISLSVIQEESESMRSHHQSAHEIVVQPEFVVETTITNPPLRTHSRNFSSPVIDEPKLLVDSPVPASDSESPESPISRDSPMSDSSSSGASTMSRPNSAPGSVHGFSSSQHYTQPQTVTTKVTTTAKLKVELHAPYYESRSESSSSSSGGNAAKARVSKDFKCRRSHR